MVNAYLHDNHFACFINRPPLYHSGNSGCTVGFMTNEDVLCEVTENHLNTGLRGIPVGTCRTSFVTPSEGVHYCGYPIRELVDFSPEDIIYLSLIHI